MEIVHRTHCNDDRIDFRMDDSIGEDCIWFQAVSASNWPLDGCCKIFGPRAIHLRRGDFERWDQDGWRLWLVEDRQGRNPEHYFFKLALVPHGKRNYGLKSCKRNGWTLIANTRDAARFQMQWLKSNIGQYIQSWNDDDIANGDSSDKNHFHMCILRPGEDSYLSTATLRMSVLAGI